MKRASIDIIDKEQKEDYREHDWLLTAPVALVMQSVDKAEVLNDSFASVFISKTSPQKSLAETKVSPLVKEGKVREYLSKLDTCKSTGPEGIHPLKLMEVAEVIARQQ